MSRGQNDELAQFRKMGLQLAETSQLESSVIAQQRVRRSKAPLLGPSSNLNEIGLPSPAVLLRSMRLKLIPINFFATKPFKRVVLLD